MLKPLSRKMKAKFATIEDGCYRSQNFNIDNFKEEHIPSLLRRSNRNLFIYTYEERFLNFYKNKHLENVNIKIISRADNLIALKFKQKQNTIHLVNAKYLIPTAPSDLFSALNYLYNKLSPDISCCYTAATFALRMWRMHYQKEDLHGLALIQENFVRKGYAGGRSEIFQTRLETGYHYDINSMYGAAMLEDMPVGYGMWTDIFHEDRIGFYKCKIDQSTQYLPPLWKKINDSLCFPADVFTGIFSTAEILTARTAGIKIKTGTGITFTEKRPIFREFILDIYELKKCEGWIASFAKKILVSFYGKFAEKKEKFTLEKISKKDFWENLKNNKTVIIDENARFVKKKIRSFKGSNHNLPFLSAHIAALARSKIYEQAKNILQNGGKIGYIETDAIFTDTKLPTGIEIGEWKWEGKVQNAKFIASKTYSYDTGNRRKYTACGIPLNQSAILPAYFAGDKVQIYKKGYKTQEIKEYSMKIKNNFYKRRTYTDNSLPLTVSEILNKMYLKI